MAGSAKSVYLTINPKGSSFKTVFSKIFFDARAYNEFIKTEEFKEKYPLTEFTLIKEVY